MAKIMGLALIIVAGLAALVGADVNPLTTLDKEINNPDFRPLMKKICECIEKQTKKECAPLTDNDQLRNMTGKDFMWVANAIMNNATKDTCETYLNPPNEGTGSPDTNATTTTPTGSSEGTTLTGSSNSTSSSTTPETLTVAGENESNSTTMPNNGTTDANSTSEAPSAVAESSPSSLLAWLLPVMGILVIAMIVGGIYLCRYTKRPGFQHAAKTNGDSGRAGSGAV